MAKKNGYIFCQNDERFWSNRNLHKNAQETQNPRHSHWLHKPFLGKNDTLLCKFPCFWQGFGTNLAYFIIVALIILTHHQESSKKKKKKTSQKHPGLQKEKEPESGKNGKNWWQNNAKTKSKWPQSRPIKWSKMTVKWTERDHSLIPHKLAKTSMSNCN